MIRAAMLSGSIASAGAAEAGPRNMSPIPPRLEAAQKIQAADLAGVEASRKALNQKVADDLQMIDERTQAHANSPEGEEELRQLGKQFGIPEEGR